MELTDKIHLLRIDFEISISPEKKLPRFVNVMIIFGAQITIVDSGVKGSEDKIFQYIEQQGRKKEEIQTLVISHAHPDHIGSAAALKLKTGCRIMAHPNEKEWIEDLELQNRERPVPGFYSLVDTPVSVDELIENNLQLKADADINMRFIHAPGHSSGSLNIHFLEDNILFTGDSIPLKNDIPNYDHFRNLMHSLDKIRKDERPKILVTSWTKPMTDLMEMNVLMEEGWEYMVSLDKVVQEVYSYDNTEPLACCAIAVQRLGLPGFLVNPVVDRAFRSHLL